MRYVLVLLLLPALASAEPAADLVLRSGDVLTQDAARPHAQAIAVRGARVVAVGDDADVAAFIGPHTRVVELRGRAVVPALTDAHAHLMDLGLALTEVDLRGCTAPDDCAQRLSPARGDWIRGRGWDQNRFAVPEFPTHTALDRVAGDRAVVLERVDGHALWLNAVAMRRAGITRATPDPAGGKIVRDGAGEPTGVFVDRAMELVTRAEPAPTTAMMEAAILRAQDVAVAAGLTEIHEMGLPLAALDVYRQLGQARRLKLRVYAFGSLEAAETLLAHAPAPSSPDAYFTLRGIKLYADGALGSRGAALLAPYSDDPSNRGLTLTPPAKLQELARRALSGGWQVAVHAIGDRGNRDVLDAYAQAGVGAAQRFRIEHAQVVALADFPRFAKLGVIASMQPTHAVSDHGWAEARLGPARLAGAYAWRRMLNAGVHVAFGSDFPVEDVSVVAGLRAAVERANWTVAEKLTRDEALAAFTTGAAYAAFEDGWRGRAAVGQAADLTVLDAPAAGLLHAAIAMTIVGGRVVYERR